MGPCGLHQHLSLGSRLPKHHCSILQQQEIVPRKIILFHHRGIPYPTLNALLTVEGRIMGAIGRKGTQRSYKAVSESMQAYKDLRKGTLNSWEPLLQAEYSSTSLHERRSIHGASTRYSESSTLQAKSRHSKCSPHKSSKTKQKSSAALPPPPDVKHGL